MKIQLPPPANWQDFEDLCHRLWSSIWGTNPQKNGRQGQPQCGVDIYGTPPYKSQYTGIQCKGKNNNYGTKLTINEIDTECQNATQFSPKIESFILATTSPRDAEIQEHCRLLTSDKKFPFNVESWSWDDISEEIQYREDIMKSAYPDYNIERTNKCIYDYYFTFSMLEAFFSRDHIKPLIKTTLCNFLSVLAFELFDNAFRHGKATSGVLEIVENTLHIMDNGEAFNPITLEGGRGGYQTINYAKSLLKNISYEYRNNNNLIIIPLDVDIPNTHKYEINLGVDQLLQRRNHILNWDVLNKVEELVINISGDLVPPSGMYNLFDQLNQLFNHKGLRTKVYVPDNLFFCTELKNRYPNIEIKIR